MGFTRAEQVFRLGESKGSNDYYQLNTLWIQKTLHLRYGHRLEKWGICGGHLHVFMDKVLSMYS